MINKNFRNTCKKQKKCYTFEDAKKFNFMKTIWLLGKNNLGC